jgi:GNAT superfamily N-acetyltransferase
MIAVLRTTSNHEDFQKMVVQLDAYLQVVDGDDHEFYSQFNKSNLLKNAIVAYENNLPVGIGAYKEIDTKTIEIKRMFTLPEHRGKGIAKAILAALENWALEENYSIALLETGVTMKNAIHLYQKMEYKITDNYGQYIGVENSICMKKEL